MARYWSDGYKETDAVGQAAPYEVTVADVARWDGKQDPLFYDKRATIGSENLLTSGIIALEFQEMRQYVQEEGGKAVYVEILIDAVTNEYGYKSDNFAYILKMFEKGKTVILHILDTDEYAYLHAATKDCFKFVLGGKSDTDAFWMYYLYSNDLIVHRVITIPTLYAWALQREKPTYTYSDVGADREGAARDAVKEHNVNTTAHADIRLLITQLEQRLNTIANSSDVELDQLAELVTYIKDNRTLIAQVTTDKINVSDIIDNLYTADSARPLSARQGEVLQRNIEEVYNYVDEIIKDLKANWGGGTGGSSSGGTISTDHLKVTGSLSMGRATNSTVGTNSTALGSYVEAKADNASAFGLGTIAAHAQQFVIGSYNEILSATYAFIIGCGDSDIARKNAHWVDIYGNAYYAGDVNVNGRMVSNEVEASAVTSDTVVTDYSEVDVMKVGTSITIGKARLTYDADSNSLTIDFDI